MKTLRYLLIAMVVMLMSMTAQAEFKYSTSKDYQFYTLSTQADDNSMSSVMGSRSTSTLMGDGSIPPLMKSGSRLPIAARNSANSPSRPRREGEADPFGGQTINDVTNPQDPGSPVGDGVWLLMALMLGYGGYMMCRRRKNAQVGI